MAVSAAGDRQDDLGADRHRHVAQRQADEEADVPVGIDQRDDRPAVGAPPVASTPGPERCFAWRPGAGSPPPSCRLRAAALRRDRCGPISRSPARSCARVDDSPHARRDQNAFPQTILAGAERSADLGVHLGNVDAVGVEGRQSLWVALLEQCHEQVFGADVIVAVVTALLLGNPKHAPRRGVKVGKQRLWVTRSSGRGRYRGDTI